MVFSSLSFLCFFFPIVILLYFICKNRVYRNVILLLSSLLFYSWGEPKNIILMLIASSVAYIGGLFIHYFDEKNNPVGKKVTLIMTVIMLVGNLFFFKYLNFLIENVNNLFQLSISFKEIILPIGISFYTFQILSYVIDLYRGIVSVQYNYFYLTLYVSFFPQLIAGPIVRYQTIEDEINCRKETWDGIIHGLKRFIIGLAKKVIIANNVALIAEIVYKSESNVFGTSLYWLAALAYALQIYFDFSGYSDMAIGLGEIFGFHFLENFNYPYISLSITDFWRRWHISLSTWFRDYIYIPLGGNRTTKVRWIMNILIVWGLTGFWHGAQWNFIFWGLYYAMLLLFEKIFFHKVLERLPKLAQWAYAMFFVLIGWVIFNITDFNQLLQVLRKMFIYQPTDWIGAISVNSSLLYAYIYLPLGCICMFPISKKIKRDEKVIHVLLGDVFYLGLLIVCIMFILSSSYNPFIYFRF